MKFIVTIMAILTTVSVFAVDVEYIGETEYTEEISRSATASGNLISGPSEEAVEKAKNKARERAERAASKLCNNKNERIGSEVSYSGVSCVASQGLNNNGIFKKKCTVTVSAKCIKKLYKVTNLPMCQSCP